jgi:Flp pilus assembly pilin Flp
MAHHRRHAVTRQAGQTIVELSVLLGVVTLGAVTAISALSGGISAALGLVNGAF